MPSVIMVKNSNRTEPNLRKKVLAFIEKLMEDDTMLGLHIEPIVGSKDPRSRTGRVDHGVRAVLFKITGDKEPSYVFAGAYQHDEAIHIAKNKILYVNPVSGVLELINQQTQQVLNTTAPEASAPSPAAVTEETATYQATVPVALTATIETVEENFTNRLAAAGYTPDLLQRKIGIDPALTTAALTATNSAELNTIVESGALWQGLAILSLQDGKTVEEVVEELRLQVKSHLATTQEKAPSTDQAVIESFEQPSTNVQFAPITSSEELQQIIENGSFDDWRTFLHPEQKIYARVNDPDDPTSIKSKGSYRISGGAGTGKTVVALHRTKFLYDRSKGKTRIILTTFNRTLADSLQNQLTLLDRSLRIANTPGDTGVLVQGPDSLAAQIWREANRQEKQTAVAKVLGTFHDVDAHHTHPHANKAWAHALEKVPDHGLEPELVTPNFLEQEYETVILGNYITTLADYVKVPRAGRGTALNRTKRMKLWKIIESYRAESALDHTFSFAEKLCLAAAILENRAENGHYLADHVIIDEAQDLSPAHWKLLRALVAEGADDLFIAEDSHQRIYGQRFPLSRFGINIRGRARRLYLNYRTTSENLDYAMRMLDGVTWEDLENVAESHKYMSARSGPKPRLMRFASKHEEYEALACLIRQWGNELENPGEIGILVRTNSLGQNVVAAMSDRGINVSLIDRNISDSSSPNVMTMFRAKGMEFRKVILFEVNDEYVPSANALTNVTEGDLEDQQLRERSLLYVASTRARDELVIMWSGQKSPLLP